MDSPGPDEQKDSPCGDEPQPKRLRLSDADDDVAAKGASESGNDSGKLPAKGSAGNDAGESGSGSDGSSESNENAGSGGAGDASDVEDSDGAGIVDAFEGELRAHLADGKTMVQAVQIVFSDENSDSDSGIGAAAASDVRQKRDAAARRLKALSLPIVSTLEGDASVATNVRHVARLCAAMYQLAEDDFQDAMATAPRPQLEFGISSMGDVARILDKAQNIVVLSGAGVSVSCGIPVRGFGR